MAKNPGVGGPITKTIKGHKGFGGTIPVMGPPKGTKNNTRKIPKKRYVNFNSFTPKL